MPRSVVAWLLVSITLALAYGARTRYLQTPTPSGSGDTSSSLPEPGATSDGAGGVSPSSIWHSRAACLSHVTAERARTHAPGKARIGAWNIRWFPDGRPGKKPTKQKGVDIEWLACAIAALRVDVLLVQEIKATRHARQRLRELVRQLNEHTRGRWRFALDDCPAAAVQHVGVLYDDVVVDARGLSTFASLNPHGAACELLMRPGYGGYFEFPGGLDLHLISVHFKSGKERRDQDLRRKSWLGIPVAYRRAQTIAKDADVILMGDLNTMGCSHCSPQLSADQELDAFDATLAALPVAFRRVEPTRSCSEYHDGRGAPLDHVVATRSLSELPVNVKVQVLGVCDDLACRSMGRRGRPAALRRLSDHCPIVVELDDVDLDPASK